MESKYNEFYKSEQKKECFSDIKMPGWPKNRVEAIVAMGGCGDVILDVGCGNGYLLFQFRKTFKRLVGIEYSGDRIKQAKLNLSGYNFQAIHGSAEVIKEVESNSIDRIITADTIEHIPDVYQAVDEMYRILKPKGILVINTPNIASIKKRLMLLMGRFPSTSQRNEGIDSDILFDGGHLHYFTFRSLRLVLEKSGFVPIKKIGYGHFGYAHNVLPSLCSGGVQWVVEKR